MRWWTIALVTWGLTGCDHLPQEVLERLPDLPRGELRAVDLVKSPSFDDMAAWSCFSYGGSSTTCGLLGYQEKPKKRDMKFGFDLVFDLYNPNASIPIPLVELLLGLAVYQNQNLGVLCVDFCDPNAEDCDPAANPEEACGVDEAEDVKGVDDFVPTVDDLIDLVGDVIDGSIDDNLLWRTLPTSSEQMCQPEGAVCDEQQIDGVAHMCCDDVCEPLPRGCTVGEGAGGTCAVCDGHLETHVAFELDVDATLGILEQLFEEAVDSVLQGKPVVFAIPYTVDGSMFFDVPRLGRKALGFGPVQDDWRILE